jgi:ATP-binding cassette subfamily B protein
MGPTMNFINQFTTALICVVGALLCIYEGFTYGYISAFTQYSKKFAGPINEMANIATDIGSALAAAERVFALIDEAPENVNDNKDAKEIITTEGKIKFDHVKFGYTDTPVLKDFSLDVLSGKKIAIVGKTGAGKTTIINILMRFYDINSGKITLDDIDTKDITRSSLRHQFAMVSQDTWLFEGTVYENLAYGNPFVTQDDVIEACKKAHIHSFIMQLPNGYSTILKENGGNISKGQKQLLTIARAMLLKSSILILDEATSNVDTKTEMDIGDAMNKLMEGKTSFIIAHRLSTIKNADTILLLSNGDVIEMGSHNELMAKQGQYYNLFISQYDR